ncbi:MAG: extracellular solute-binding protein [Anaerolineales bacterium]|nr:extracellular solute-binding protein [Anaerolineales bacterium]
MIAGKLRNLIQHLRLITHQLAGQPGAGEATTALTNTQVALSSVLRIITDTATDALTLLEITHSHTTAEFNQPNDIVVSDVIWLPSVHAELLDLTEHFGLEQYELIPDLAETCRIEGRLVAFPYVLDLGLLYYRRDLLERHGFGAPPQTWDELTVMASEIQASERAAGHAEFWGYLWQGQISERLVLQRLEWQHAEGGGTIVEPAGTISVNNLRVQNAIERARSWIGSISPPGIVQYDEAHTVKAWMNGNGAFMRLWTTPFSMWPAPVYRAAGANLVDVTGVTLLPSGTTRRAATLGGWPFAIRRDSRDQASALNLIGALASPEAQRQRALLDEFHLPSLRRLYFDADISAKHPLTTEVLELIEAGGLAIRPTKVAGDLYPHVANAYGRAVAKILYDGANPAETLALLEEQLTAIGGWPVQRLRVSRLNRWPCP